MNKSSQTDMSHNTYQEAPVQSSTDRVARELRHSCGTSSQCTIRLCAGEAPEFQTSSEMELERSVIASRDSRDSWCQEKPLNHFVIIPRTMSEAGVGSTKGIREHNSECELGVGTPQSKVRPIYNAQVCAGRLIDGGIHEPYEPLRVQWMEFWHQVRERWRRCRVSPSVDKGGSARGTHEIDDGGVVHADESGGGDQCKIKNSESASWPLCYT